MGNLIAEALRAVLQRWATTVLKDWALRAAERVRARLSIPQWREKLVLLSLTASMVAGMLRVIIGLIATVFPPHTFAGQIAQRTVELGTTDFWLACAAGSLGGVASLFREMRQDWSQFRFLWAIGHLVTAQFAALMTYLLAVTWELPVTMALASSGLFGWMGNAGLEKLSSIATRALGLNPPTDPPAGAPS